MTLSEKSARLRELKREAKQLAREIKKARPKIARPPAPGPSPDVRRAEHRASTGLLREAVLKRSGGKCETCGFEFGPRFDMHHVEAAGLRRSRQREGNVLAICMDCHRLAHRSDVNTLRWIAQARPLDAEARRAAQHRLDKVLEARGVPVHVEEERG